MARRKTTAADIGCLAVVVLLAALALLGPLALAVWSIFCELRALAYRNIRSVRDVLSADEQAMLELAEQQCDRYESLISQTMHRGIASGFARRADGLFDARRFQARELNTTIEALQNQRDIALSNLGHLQNTLGRKLGGWLNAMSGVTGARAGVIAFIVSFVTVTAFTGGSLTPTDLLFGSPLAEPGSRLATSLISVGISAIVMFTAGSISRSALAA
jgi:hypothetical protein